MKCSFNVFRKFLRVTFQETIAIVDKVTRSIVPGVRSSISTHLKSEIMNLSG